MGLQILGYGDAKRTRMLKVWRRLNPMACLPTRNLSNQFFWDGHFTHHDQLVVFPHQRIAEYEEKAIYEGKDSHHTYPYIILVASRRDGCLLGHFDELIFVLV